MLESSSNYLESIADPEADWSSYPQPDQLLDSKPVRGNFKALRKAQDFATRAIEVDTGDNTEVAIAPGVFRDDNNVPRYFNGSIKDFAGETADKFYVLSITVVTGSEDSFDSAAINISAPFDTPSDVMNADWAGNPELQNAISIVYFGADGHITKDDIYDIRSIL